MAEMIPWRIADDLINEALAWAEVSLRVETVEGGQAALNVTDPTGTIGELVSAIIFLYLRFRDHEDAKRVLERAAQLRRS